MALLLILIGQHISAQIVDDFSDGDFAENPAWTGTDTIFVVNDKKQLQLNASNGGNATLFLENPFASCLPTGDNSDIEWRFWVKEAFAPSTKNFTDVFLCDNYFIRFGEAGNQDVIDLQRVDGNENVSICRGTDTFIATAFSSFIKVIRTGDGHWQIFIDKTGDDNYILETQCVDSTYFPSGNFGFKITFSKTNATKVYFDDIYIGPKIIDSEPPELEKIIVADNHNIKLHFNENLDAAFALDINNYSVDNQLFSPEKVEFFENNSTLILTFSEVIREDTHYMLTINKIQDLCGNVTENIRRDFIYHTTGENDLVINEIMADPEPSVGIPPYEYIEIYNTSAFPIDIGNWFLIIGTSEKEISESVVIQPDSYLLLCKNNAVESLSGYGQCVGFTSFSIANAGARIELRNEEYVIMASVEFSSSWYRDKDKLEGGWSLEQIDPEVPCAGKENWGVCTDARGGTPGEVNSIDARNPLIPNIDFVNVISEKSIEVVFNQKMNPESLRNIEDYYVTEFDSNPVEAYTFSDNNNVVQLVFNQEFMQNRIYTILINNVLNCSGISVPQNCSCCFGLPVSPEPGDIVINEILFNPIEPAGDYIELFNKSDKILNLSDLKIGVIKTTFPNPPDTTARQICNENRLFLPFSLVLLTNKSEEIGKQYECSTENFIEMQNFPQYPNNDAAAILLHGAKTIDVIGYSEDFHHPLLSETKGVSLERIGNDWHSSAAPLYGTPGKKNSSFVEYSDITDEIVVTPEVFSPDGDGFDDITTIHYNFDKEGFVVNISIFDSYGTFIRQVCDNNLAATNGFFCWDGVDENGRTVRPGIYIVFTEIFNLQGVVKRYKDAVVVASK